jgi:CubicO group peptidase (beta-lactamase class C family)
MKITKLITLIFLGIYLGVLPIPNAARPVVSLASDPSTILIGPSDPAEIGSFLDSLFNQQLEQNRIVGITAVMVKDGQVIFQRGYGQSDLEKKIPVDPSNSLFRIGSVTKVITWIAVLQLYELGQLDLDADVNTYLDFHIPDSFPEPITMKHLMSHTAGFEDRKYEMAVMSPELLPPLGTYLASHIPARVRPVGQISAYSNYGADLAGYIVERISGLPFADYIKTNIFTPVGMDKTTAEQPLSAGLSSSMAQGYRYIDGTIQPGFFELLSTQPAGSISSTSADMARFMIACLNGDLFSHESTQKLMFSRLWSHSPEFTGFTYGFWESQMHGQRVLYHPGSTLQFHSLLMLIPDQNLGFFFSYNTETANNLWDKTLLDFMQHYYPMDTHIPSSNFSTEAQLSRFAGTYHIARSSYTTIEKVNDLLEEWLVVEPTSNGTLLFGSPLQPQKAQLIQSQPLLFIEPQHGIQLAFREDDQGNITHMIDLHLPAQTFEKVPWHANPLLHYVLLVICCILFLSAIFVGMTRGFIHFFHKYHETSTPALPTVARWLSSITSAIFLMALIAFAVLYLDKNGFSMAIGFGQASTITVILAAWLVAAVLTLGLIVFTLIAWFKRYWGIASRIHYTTVTLAAIAFVWFLNYWNLLGFRY